VNTTASALLCAAALLCSALLCSACSSRTDTIKTKRAALVCQGQKQIAVTAAFLPPVAESGDADQISPTADAELLGVEPNVFGIAWVHTDHSVHVSTWNADTRSFGTEHTLLFPVGTRKWVSRMGYTHVCGAIPGSSCGWFTWEDDTWGPELAQVRWQAFSPNGLASFPYYADGHDPSGDCGNVENTHRCLLAYIGRDRRTVKAKLLDNYGLTITDLTIHSVPSPWQFRQTRVAYDQNSNRFLVTWTINTDYAMNINGAVQTHYVTFDGVLGPQRNHVMYCEGHWDQPFCPEGGSGKSSPTPTMPDAGIAPKPDAAGSDAWSYAPAATTRAGSAVTSSSVRVHGGTCPCHLLWLANSRLGSATDRFRIRQYSFQARLNSWGGPHQLERSDATCINFCPVGQADFETEEGFAPFLMAKVVGPAELHRGVIDTHRYLFDDALSIGSEYWTPVALRTPNQRRTIGLALLSRSSEETAELSLSVVETQTNGCP
jgi:hypothetical protein